jgi:hypothetical protein
MNELAAKAKRRLRIGIAGFALLSGLSYRIATGWLGFASIHVIIAFVLFGIGWLVVPFRYDQKARYTSDKSPEEVRSEFLREDSPLLCFKRARADEIQHYENGVEYTIHFSIGSPESIYFETEARPDGSIVVFDDQHDDPTEISIVDDGDRTIVVVDFSTTRTNLAAFCLLKFSLTPYRRKARQLRGYEVIEKKREYSIW